MASTHGSGPRIAVVGAGIAGAGAAWALHRAGFDVEVFEAGADAGGNAKTHAWTVGDRRVVTGLSVLAWPPRFFRNYERLLRTLGVETEEVTLRFFIRRGADTYAHGMPGTLGARYADDLRRWRRLCDFAGAVNRAVLGPESERSLYAFSLRNPLNYTPLRALAAAFGVSDGFFRDVLVPLYSTSFLTTRIGGIPAVVVPALDRMISVEHGGVMHTWRASTSSAEVFARLLAGLDGRVHTGRRITGVRRGGGRVELCDDTGAAHTFDRVVFACDATSAAAALDRPTRLERELLAKVTYTDDRDTSFLAGHVHGDASVLPEEHRDAILRGYATYVDVVEEAGGALRYENHFVLSSWMPAARGTGAVMMVHYEKPEGRRLDRLEKVITNRRAHPDLSPGNLGRAFLLRLLQGRGGLYYAGSYTTPGNGHDLSLLSGLVVANALGAPYPFEDDPDARADFERLRRFMLGR
jgi:predicted NAD/FAD-binding protein